VGSGDWPVLLAGFLFGMSLIVAIGAQNLYVLRQGVLRQYVPLVVGICAVSDLALISLGVALDGEAIGGREWVLRTLRWAGALFVFGYALMAARRAFRSGCAPLASSWRSTSVAAVAAAALAFTWLNPAAYFDTIVLVGTVANTTPGREWWFGGGAAIASMLWFVSLGFGAQFLAPLFAHARSWRALDAFTAVVMVGIGLRVLLG